LFSHPGGGASVDISDTCRSTASGILLSIAAPAVKRTIGFLKRRVAAGLDFVAALDLSLFLFVGCLVDAVDEFVLEVADVVGVADELDVLELDVIEFVETDEFVGIVESFASVGADLFTLDGLPINFFNHTLCCSSMLFPFFSFDVA